MQEHTWSFFGFWLVGRLRGQGFGTGGVGFCNILRQPIKAQRPAAETVSGKRRIQLVTLGAPPVVLREKHTQSDLHDNNNNKCVFVFVLSVCLTYGFSDLCVFIKGVFILRLEDGDLIHLDTEKRHGYELCFCFVFTVWGKLICVLIQ